MPIEQSTIARIHGPGRGEALISKIFQWKMRHTVLSIVFITSSVSFMDRVAMSVAIPYIATDYHLSPWAMGVVMSIFFAAYGLTQVPGGLLADIFGVRKVATIAMLWWSVFTAITGAAANATQMVVARFLFGLGEGMFPAAAFKTIAIWFPKKERATATAIFLAANPFGSALAPLAVVGIVSSWGWRAVFYSLFLPGILMAILFWMFVPDQPSQSRFVTPEELGEIEEGGDAAVQNSEMRRGFFKYLVEPSILKCFFILFAFDIALWGFTTWLPTYLVKVRGFSMAQMGMAASLPYLVGIVGCLLGGWVSDKYFSNNRRILVVSSQLVSAYLLYLTLTVKSVTMLVICETLGGSCLLFSLAAVWALPMSIVPKQLMGITGGFINVAGQIAAFISPLVIGYLVGIAGGRFGPAFIFLIASLLVSSAIVFTLPSKLQHHQEGDVQHRHLGH
jgi:sugar phosphate permease